MPIFIAKEPEKSNHLRYDSIKQLSRDIKGIATHIAKMGIP